jgi:hypothetical protein
MFRILVLAALLGAASAATDGAAPAAFLAPPGTGSGATSVVAAGGPHGRALVSFEADAGLQLAERGVDGRWGRLQTIAPQQVFPELVTRAPDGAAVVLADDRSDAGVEKLVVFRRAPGAASFGVTTLAQASGIGIRAATDGRGDIAVLVSRAHAAGVLLTAVAGNAFAAPRPVPNDIPTDAVAIGGDGQVVIAGYDRRRRGVYASRGTAGGSLGAPHLLATPRAAPQQVVAAIDDAGTATVAFDDARNRDSALVALRARPATPFGSAAVIGRGERLVAAAAGTTTALAWQPSAPASFDGLHAYDAKLRVAIARGSGRFARAQAPSAPAVGEDTPSRPTLAVDRAGDVLLVYAYGLLEGNAVHATLRSARRARFGPPHVISTPGTGNLLPEGLQGAEPVAALLSERRPLVAYADAHGAIAAATRLSGPRPDLTAPRATVTPQRHATAALQATNAVNVNVRCSETCIMRATATLHTAHTTTLYEPGATVLPRGRTLTKRFWFDPAKHAGRIGRHARLRVTIHAENASGASSDTTRQIMVGAER